MAKVTIPVLIDWNSIKDYMAQNDVIQVIRCKDCKHLTHTPHKWYKWYCPINRKVVDRDEFCRWAERKSE